MNAHERDGLVSRIRQIRRLAVVRAPSPVAAQPRLVGRMAALEARISDLEQLIIGLQDSVHRESDRHGKLISELQAQIQPEAMGAALADDARQRGV